MHRNGGVREKVRLQTLRALKVAEKALKAVPARTPPKDSKLLECLRCQRRYSRSEIVAGLYRLETMVCSYCYAALQKAPHAVCCFGKPTTILLDGTKLLGYDPACPECRNLCPDSALCALIVDPDSTLASSPPPKEET